MQPNPLIVSGCFWATLAELNRWDRDCMDSKPNILTIWSFKKKFVDPSSRLWHGAQVCTALGKTARSTFSAERKKTLSDSSCRVVQKQTMAFPWSITPYKVPGAVVICFSKVIIYIWGSNWHCNNQLLKRMIVSVYSPVLNLLHRPTSKLNGELPSLHLEIFGAGTSLCESPRMRYFWFPILAERTSVSFT